MQTHLRVVAPIAVLIALAGCANKDYPGGPNRPVSGVSPLVYFSPPPGMVAFSSPATLGPESTGSASTRESTQVNAVHLSANGRDLIVEFVTGLGDLAARAYADETSEEVDVHVLVTSIPGTYPAMGFVRTLTIPLKAPLSGRRVVAAPGASVPIAGIGGAPTSPSAPTSGH
jgi:hypothetical protein